MFLVTGGAGFIGSNIAAALEAADADVVIGDRLGSSDVKWRNIAKRRLFDIVAPQAIADFLARFRGKVRGVVHMGGISSTTETDVDTFVSSNLRLSIDIWNHCAEEGIPLVYASSAATYGDGRSGFEDRSDADYLSRLRPLSPYAWSKHLFDRWVSRAVETGAPGPPRWAGPQVLQRLRSQRVSQGGPSARSPFNCTHRFASSAASACFDRKISDYPDGGQLRDFVWVGDCVDATLWALEHPAAPSEYTMSAPALRGLSSTSRLFCFSEWAWSPTSNSSTCPYNLRDKYQYYTCAAMDKLRAAGFATPSTSLEDGLRRYVAEFLETDDPFR